MTTARRQGTQEKPRTSRSLAFFLPPLFLLLALLLFAGWLVAVGPEGENAPAPAGDVSPDATDRDEWTTGDPERRRDGVTRGRGQPPESVLLIEVPYLGDAIRAGDVVEIVWVSADGGVWKKVIGRSLKVQDLFRNEVIVAATPEEAQAVEEAKSRGRVFAAPP